MGRQVQQMSNVGRIQKLHLQLKLLLLPGERIFRVDERVDGRSSRSEDGEASGLKECEIDWNHRSSLCWREHQGTRTGSSLDPCC